jgi:hypothetical protein
MDMRVDTAGCDIGTLSIEDFCCCTVMRRKKTTSNGEDFPILNPSRASFSMERLVTLGHRGVTLLP